LLVEGVEEGYARYFRGELRNQDAIILAAEVAGDIVGYSYGRLESRDWNLLLDACGALHDVFVREDMRGRGIARALVQATIDAMEAKGAPRFVLSTAVKNEAAQRLFESMGFRKTMIEMTCEASDGAVAPTT